MAEDLGASQPHYALLAYARDMHQYTLELWMELNKKLDGTGEHAVPTSDLSTINLDEHPDAPRRGAPSDDADAESPQDE